MRGWGVISTTRWRGRTTVEWFVGEVGTGRAGQTSNKPGGEKVAPSVGRASGDLRILCIPGGVD